MECISVFAGIGGFDLGFERAGIRIVAQIEIDTFARSVLKKNFPGVQIIKDVRDAGSQNLPSSAQVICGGFPCQDVSIAGKRKGLKGKRSTLWSEFYRIVCEIRPEWVVVENVPGLYTANSGRFFAKILWDLHTSGYDAEWHTVPASTLGAPHRRERVFIIAYPSGKRWRRSFFADFKNEIPLHQEWNSSQNIFNWNGWVSWLKSLFSVSNWHEITGQVRRVDDGLPSRLDRTKVLGNAVMPQISEILARSILQAEAYLTTRETDQAMPGGNAGDLSNLENMQEQSQV